MKVGNFNNFNTTEKNLQITEGKAEYAKSLHGFGNWKS